MTSKDKSGIKKIVEAIGTEKGDPANYLIALKYIDTLSEMVSGKDNKTIYMPYEASGVLASLGGIKDMLRAKK